MSSPSPSPSPPIREILLRCLPRGIPLRVEDLPPPYDPKKYSHIPHAPIRTPNLSAEDTKIALRNALRYFSPSLHPILSKEFADELREDGHIYMRRFQPTEYEMKAYPIHEYPGNCISAKCIMLMIMNNLSPSVAQFPCELITYGGNGSVLSNWIQYHLLMKYLYSMNDQQTLTMSSGHPNGLFPSHGDSPRVVISNGMTIPNYSKPEDFDKMYAMGVTQYGQMTAGSYCYIGSAGIVHGTYITILSALRRYLGCDSPVSSVGKIYVSSGLGGMSGAQGKAAIITGASAVIAEVDESALNKRLSQGWITEKIIDINVLIERLKILRKSKETVAIGFLGNAVALWERLAEEKEILVDLGSDQTSLHNPFNGGYYPVQLDSVAEAQRIMRTDPAEFRRLVEKSLCRQVTAINKLTQRGMRFWDYGNSFLLQSSRAGADIWEGDVSLSGKFKYPTYIQEFVGNVFSLGFGPFRWVCCSGEESDLLETDKIAADVIRKSIADVKSELKENPSDELTEILANLTDNLFWIERAHSNRLVVGSQARILYADCVGRRDIAIALNSAIAEGRLKGPVVLSRDHHDVSGTDSPWRETSNIADGSQFTADMAVHNVIGDAMRGATWVALHNGGGCGWGEVINGGFGMVLDGSADSARRASLMLQWDVNNGVTRRAWAGNRLAKFAIQRAMRSQQNLQITQRNEVDEDVINKALTQKIQ